METGKVAGLVLLVVGLILLFFGWQGSESLGDQVTETITGRFTDETMWYLIGGAAALAAGAYLTFFKR
jgi:drug/metabolite transporter (DMT)-like permease